MPPKVRNDQFSADSGLPRHCEERSDAAISMIVRTRREIAALRSQ